MSLLDDAKRLADDDPVEADDGQDYPAFCRLCLSYKPHAPDCPRLSMPRLVALVEAAEAVVKSFEANPRVVWDSPTDALIDKLSAALRGEGATA